MKTYLSDEIGNEYEKWNMSDIIILKSPTGGGKTTFICEKLIPYAVMKRKRVLYLVNRKILLEQIKEDISLMPYDIQVAIDIMTYQHLESQIKYGTTNDLFEHDYVICDEAHYFMSDSLFNTNTSLSYYWIMDNFRKQTIVFMSATIDQMEKQIRTDMSLRTYNLTPVFRLVEPITTNIPSITEKKEPRVYGGSPKYNYINYHIINSIEEHIADICESSDRWLIFVDTINEGKKLCKDINDFYTAKYDDNQVVAIFLSAKYNEEFDAVEEVRTITIDKRQSVKVLICTAVMDNGISLKDYKLRNLVIDCEIEDTFIQMLGRKRVENENVDLFLVNRELKDIIRRSKRYDELGEVCKKYLASINNLCRNTFDYILENENKFAVKCHSRILEELIHKRDERIQRLFYAHNGMLKYNPLSFRRVEYLERYYSELIEEMKNDRYALARRQLGWLGLKEDEVEKIVYAERETKYEDAWKQVNAAFEDSYLSSMVYNKETFIEFKNEISKALIILVVEKCSFEDKVGNRLLENLSKNDRPLTKEGFTWLHEHCDLMFELKKTIHRRTKLEREKNVDPKPTTYQIIFCE